MYCPEAGMVAASILLSEIGVDTNWVESENEPLDFENL